MPFDAPSDLIANLQHVLTNLTSNPYPYIPNPPQCKKRASVALVIRIRPHPSQWPSKEASALSDNETPSVADQLETFFGEDWVKQGDPEVLFIKRAARSGDRWTGHVALPGGKRDPEDEDDRAAAIRETLEEVGLELTAKNAISVGNLPERVVTTSWGKVPLMVLCPFVFLVTQHEVQPLRLQPSEVGSAHWVSVRALLSPALRTFERADVTDRLASRWGMASRGFLRAMLGQMLFSAVRLVPTESLYSSTIPGFLPEPASNSIDGEASYFERLMKWQPGEYGGSTSTDKPLLLWGLTLGILADFLMLLPPHDAMQLWTYPTFSRRDVRFVVWMMTYSFRRRKESELEHGEQGTTAAIEEGLDAVSAPTAEKPEVATGVVGMGRLGVGNSQSSAVGLMLEGYYDLVRKAVTVTMIGRGALVVTLATTLWIRFRRNQA
ncbi:MAG: hypothetical protein M1819_001600 [Sarea resinae]|nr:MAG: hypothetical protein M1819_001600 [Sarea resinae]